MSKLFSENRQARHNYSVLEDVEAGIALKGWDIKEILNGHISLQGCYAKIINGECFLIGKMITSSGEYQERKLLLHKRQIINFEYKVNTERLTLIPLECYANDKGIVKIKLGLCKGNTDVDKRHILKEKDVAMRLKRGKLHEI